MSLTGVGMAGLTGHDPRTYVPHALHASGRSYQESNCYADIIVELLHARGHEPLAGFGFLVRMDFEGDQWTFFKPPPEDLEMLYGIDIHEMQPYRPLPVQIAEQLGQGRTIIVELDSWFLPDTASTSYHAQHVKTSVAAEAIAPQDEVLRYFHGPGLYELSGEDYRGVFRLGEPADAALPPYTEIARFDAGEPLSGEALRGAARALLGRHLERRPTSNPFERFGEQLDRAMPGLLSGDLDDYHAYAFATVRMAGSAFEIAADHVRWVFGESAESELAALEEIVGGCKALSFRLARRKPFETAPRVAALGQAWERTMTGLAARVG